MHGSDACRKALVSGYVVTTRALYRASLLRTQMFNDVYVGDESGMAVWLAKIFVGLRENITACVAV